MKYINLAIAYDKYFWVLKNVIASSGVKVKVDSTRSISQINKIILKRNYFIVITINDTFYGKSIFYVISKFVLRASKIIIAVLTLSGRRILKFVFPFNFFVCIPPKCSM